MSVFSVMHSCKHLISTCYVPGLVRNILLVSGDTILNKIEVTFLIEPVFAGKGVQTTNKQTKEE